MKPVAHDLSRYAALVQSLAKQAISQAIDASPHKPRTGETRYSLTAMLPAAAALLANHAADLTPPPTDQPCAFVDGVGHERPAYRYLAAHLHHRATGCCPPMVYHTTQDISLELWQHWHRLASGGDDLAPIHRIVESHAGSLHPQSFDEPPDHWTYRELVGLHALQALAEWCENTPSLGSQPAWRQRLAEATSYHQDHTQPDYTTYQPWALSVFLSNPDTVMFAEQQLHDTQTHLQIEGGAGALLPALLLADASVSILSGMARGK